MIGEDAGANRGDTAMVPGGDAETNAGGA